MSVITSFAVVTYCETAGLIQVGKLVEVMANTHNIVIGYNLPKTKQKMR